MAPALRNSTQLKTAVSAKPAEDAGYTRRPRAPPSRKQRYKRNKGLVSMKAPKSLQHISVANATTSPLLQLPAEIRNMIFKFAVRPTWPQWIGLCFNCQATPARKYDPKDLAILLPGTCRQIYAETATLIYAENCFAFQNEWNMVLWLYKRLVAQREAIRYLMLPNIAYELGGYNGDDWPWRSEKERIANQTRKLFPNLVDMEDNEWLQPDECLCATPAM